VVRLVDSVDGFHSFFLAGITVKVVIDGNRLVMEHAQENWQKKLDDVMTRSKWGC
jgi:hypothetical protein